MKATNLLHRAMRAVYYRRIAITIEMAIKVGIFCIIAVLIVALAAAGTIRSEWSPDGGVQWLLVKPWSCCIGRCAP
jgi:hypothetical protein